MSTKKLPPLPPLSPAMQKIILDWKVARDRTNFQKLEQCLNEIGAEYSTFKNEHAQWIDVESGEEVFSMVFELDGTLRK